eukprot:165010-Amphidinium_carterae.2
MFPCFVLPQSRTSSVRSCASLCTAGNQVNGEWRNGERVRVHRNQLNSMSGTRSQGGPSMSESERDKDGGSVLARSGCKALCSNGTPHLFAIRLGFMGVRTCAYHSVA